MFKPERRSILGPIIPVAENAHRTNVHKVLQWHDPLTEPLSSFGSLGFSTRFRAGGVLFNYITRPAVFELQLSH